MSKRIKTSYPGVYYREARRLGFTGTERVYYIVFKKEGKVYEEKAGRQLADDMTPSKAAGIRAERIEGKRMSRKEIRKLQKAKEEDKRNRWTIDRLWDEYKTQRRPKGIAQDESRYKNYIRPMLGDRESTDILMLDVDRLRVKLLKTKSPQTTKLTLALLRRIINFGVKRQLCYSLPFSIEMPKVNNEKTEDLSEEQLSSLLLAIEKDEDMQAANFMRIALFTGMRRGELFKLQWKDIDFDRGFIHIKDPKGGPDQRIPLNEAAKSVLENHPKTDSPYVFPGRGGGRRTDIKKAVNKIKDEAGLPQDFRPLHGLRHKSPQMTQRYAHLRDEALKRAADVAGTLFDQAINGKDRVTDLKQGVD